MRALCTSLVHASLARLTREHFACLPLLLGGAIVRTHRTFAKTDVLYCPYYLAMHYISGIFHNSVSLSSWSLKLALGPLCQLEDDNDHCHIVLALHSFCQDMLLAKLVGQLNHQLYFVFLKI